MPLRTFTKKWRGAFRRRPAISGPNNSDRDTLGRRLKRRESWGERFGIAVGIGLIVEYWDDIIGCFVHWHAPPMPLLGGLLVTIGVLGEVLFSRLVVLTSEKLQDLADSEVSQAKKQAAEALERAAKAELDLARLRQPRMLHDKVVLIAHIKPFSGTKYNFESVFQDSESVDLLIQIEGILSSSGWIRQKGLGKFPALAIWGQTDAVSVGVYSGIHIVVEDTGSERGPLWTAAEALGAVLRSSLGPDSNIAAGVVVAAQASPTSIQIIHINVGKKP